MSNPLSDSWGDFLCQFRWDWYVTLTFAGDVKTFTARNRCNAWLKSLERAAGQPISWFLGEEFGDRFGKFHLHLLIGNVAHLHRFTWMKHWEVRNGWARIYEFTATKGAAYYVAKYVTKQFGEWELSDNIEVFRIQQPTLPLSGQKGSPRTDKITRPEDESRLNRMPLNGIEQLVFVDFTEPDMSEVDTDEVRASFRLEIKIKKRR
jgi:hypothetical protein